MAPSAPHRSFCSAIALFALLCLASCAVPLAPGYKIEKQSITVRFVPGTPPHLSVRAGYRLTNVGNAPLDFVEVGLPGRKSFGRENLRVQVQGHDVAAAIARGEDVDEGESSSPDAWPVVFRIPFSPAWPRKQKRNLVIAYDLTASSEPLLRMYVSPAMFYLNDTAWFPDPLAPKSLFTKDLVRPDPSDLNLIIPQNFLATASGELHGARKSAAETEYHFRIGKDDFDPFVIAGQYHEQRVTTNDGTIAFWTFKPMTAAHAQKTALQIASTATFYAQTFGPLPPSMNAIYEVELPESAPAMSENMKKFPGSSPPGVVYDLSFSPASGNSAGTSNTSSPIFSSSALALTWFNHMIRPEADAWILGRSLAAYASELQPEKSESLVSRENAIVSVLHDFDDKVSKSPEKPILSSTPTDSPDQLAIGEAKHSLFLFALEDKCGRDNLNHAIAHMISALRFQQYDYDDFRSAVEQECHQDLGPFFRTWLNEKGIPADFRAKYEPASEKKN